MTTCIFGAAVSASRLYISLGILGLSICATSGEGICMSQISQHIAGIGVSAPRVAASINEARNFNMFAGVRSGSGVAFMLSNPYVAKIVNGSGVSPPAPPCISNVSNDL